MRDIGEILDSIPSGKVKKKRDLIKAALGNGIDDVSRMLVKDTLELLDHLEKNIEKISLEILSRLQKRAKDLAIVMSVPGIGFTSGSIILAEIGDYRDFHTPEQLAKWCGLVPGLNESAGKKKPCGITKQGSKSLRTVLVEIAQVVAKMSNNKLSRFFHRLRARKKLQCSNHCFGQKINHHNLSSVDQSRATKRVAVALPDDARDFLENEAKETGVPLSNLMSYIAVNYVREEKKKRAT